MPGIFVQTLAFTSFGTALGLANDRRSGFVDRLLALPTSRSSLLVGRVSSDMLVTCLTLTILIVTGLAIGWRPHTNVLDFVLAIALMLLFSLSMTWLGVLLRCVVSEPEAVMGVGFIVLFPLTFVANACVPTEECRHSCRPWPSGTRSAPSRRRPASCSATPTPPWRRPTRGRWSTRSPPRCCCASP